MDRIEDLLCTMWETSPSIAEWAECIRRNEPRSTACEYVWQYPARGGSLVFADIYDEEQKGKRWTLDIKSIQSGLEIMARYYPLHFNDFMEENEDSITADIFLQCALFEKVIYS